MPFRNLMLDWAASQNIPLAEHITPWGAPAGACIYDAGQPITDLIFLERGVVTACGPIADGKRVVLWVIGGWFVIGGRQLGHLGKHAVTSFTARTAAAGYSIPRKTLKALTKEHKPLHDKTRSLIRIMDDAVHQSAFCLAEQHPPIKRFCRFLLMLDDIVDDHRIELSTPAIAAIAAIPTSTAQAIAKNFVARGLISKIGHHAVVLTNRPEIHALSCECYDLMIARRDKVYVS